MRRARTARYFCGEYTRGVLIFTPSQNGPEGGHTLWPPNLHKRPPPSKSTIQLASTSSYLNGPSQSKISTQRRPAQVDTSKRQHNTFPIDVGEQPCRVRCSPVRPPACR